MNSPRGGVSNPKGTAKGMGAGGRKKKKSPLD